MNLFTGLFANLQDEANALIQALRRSVVVVQAGDAQGTGLVWGRQGHVLTNHHVAHRDRAAVYDSDGRRLTASVVARDPQNDLALLRLEVADLPPAPLSDSRALQVGELVLAVGTPLGVAGTATLGIVSGVGNATWMGHARRDLLQADVTLAPGSSGGPLANVRGEVVGIASMILSPGIALAVPVHVAQAFAQTALAPAYPVAA